MRVAGFLCLSLLSCAFASNNKNEIDQKKNDRDNRWTGFTIGANVGGLINASHATLRPSGDFLTPHYASENGLRRDKIHFHDGGFAGGIQAGYNYQFKYLVLGIETDFNYSSIDKKHYESRELSAPLLGTFTHTIKDELNWFGTVRPRVGVPIHPVLIYVTGGYLYGHIKSSTDAVFSRANDTYVGSMSKTIGGWTLGGGLEWGFFKKWSAKVEYLYLDFKKHSYVSPVTNPVFGNLSYTTDLKNEDHLVRFGINYTI